MQIDYSLLVFIFFPLDSSGMSGSHFVILVLQLEDGIVELIEESFLIYKWLNSACLIVTHNILFLIHNPALTTVMLFLSVVE